MRVNENDSTQHVPATRPPSNAIAVTIQQTASQLAGVCKRQVRQRRSDTQGAPPSAPPAEFGSPEPEMDAALRCSA